MSNFKELKALLNEHAALFDQLIDFENMKLDAIAANDLVALEQQMKDEQVFLMKLKVLDQKRDRLLSENQLEGKTFRELIEIAVGEDQLELQNIFNGLSVKLDELKAATSSTKKYIDLHLHSLDILINKLQHKESPSVSYEKDGNVKGTSVELFKPQKI